MASSISAPTRSSYSDKQPVSSIDHGPEVVPQTQPYPDAYAYANPNNTNNDSSRGGAQGGGLEIVQDAAPSDWVKPAWSEEKPRKQRMCGLSKTNFIIVVAVATVLIAAAIIGGSVGGVLASRNSSGSAQADSLNSSTGSSSTSQPTEIQTSSALSVETTSEPVTSTDTASSTRSSSTKTTSTSSASTPTSSEGTYNCPSDNDSVYTSGLSGGGISSQKFTILCDTDWPEGVEGADGEAVVDLTAVISYSIEDCIDSCVAYNIAGGSCGAVVYGANITLALSRGDVTGNCFLKSEPGQQDTADNSGQVEAAFLV